MNTTRELLRRHTADLIRPRWDQHKATLGDLVTTAHNPAATDTQAEEAALAFLEEWGRHPVYCKTARYGLILHVMRDRLNQFDVRPGRFDTHVKRLGYAATADWYAQYTGTTPQPAQAFEDVPLFEVNA